MPNPTFMHRCLSLAALGRGKVGNGALVGAVLVRGNNIIAEGFHTAYGAPHAERALLESFTGSIEPEDVLYVNLEPCRHHGKTPPCTDILLERGIKNVVFGMLDPDPRVAGKGTQLLLSKGVKVGGPIEQILCTRFNRGYISTRTNARPWITIKMAKDRAGRISKSDGSPLKITSQEQDIWSHTWLRSTHDAILVGVGTIKSDNPKLNRRFAQNNKFSLMEGLNEESKISNNIINPYRIILDPAFTVSHNAQVVTDELAAKTIICSGEKALDGQVSKRKEFLKKGVQMFAVPLINSAFDWRALWDALMTPKADFFGITSILVEGGAATWDQFQSAGMVDEEVCLTGMNSSFT